ncbi:Hypothetical protein RMHFA_01974 [Roseomonas mucosa]|jgi:hypothetical protein|uniref:Uncharacterized protein n=1 Tax=Roseomonas mucosa TaxID=207340 RepID=A0A4Y1MWB9_9PROT|nr:MULTISPECIES: hypothetical protein [Roseomonas]MDT8263394.1 hypothetical protein [Roseomonas sp. DSM 102946]ATR21090.1 hypothetical protein CTJ15_12780 [Roseomonas sp. FDAARGOS_362]AWV22335.1 hypothetical protein RADP37_01974 [Roseomonas mucosa]MDT8276053.1 hypothetical protein [Roseomonas mucosa]MDT8352925.1 hypothetical protein [Roseomonas mucosa]
MPHFPFLRPSAEDELRTALDFLDSALRASRHAARRHHVAKAIERLASAHYLLGHPEDREQEALAVPSGAGVRPA